VAGPVRTSRRAPGRHFLDSKALSADLVACAGIGARDLAVDVGAGTGRLTAELSRRAAAVWAIELDPGLAAHLRRRFAGTNVRVVEADAAWLAWPREPFRVVANLPFTRSGEILRGLLADPRTPLVSADVILQWEAACKRAALWPSTLLGVYWGAWYELRLARRIDASAFAPPPSVGAGVLRITRRPAPLVADGEHAAYEALLRRGFRHGAPLRRALRPHLSALELKRLARDLGFSPDARAHDLDAVAWAALFRLTTASVRSTR
jgi:23S rRNA (adenine-N6)-dimethyltransferase